MLAICKLTQIRPLHPMIASKELQKPREGLMNVKYSFSILSRELNGELCGATQSSGSAIEGRLMEISIASCGFEELREGRSFIYFFALCV